MPPGWPTLPSSAFSALTASALKSPLVCASGAPPMNATAGCSSTSACAIRSIFLAATPVICSTFAGV